jgi:lantibiotic biosynthesis dehydratase-like protein
MTSPPTLPDHLIPLPAESTCRWALWRTVCVRGAGFPAAGVLRLADADCAAAADRLNAAAAATEGLREAALTALRGELAAAGKDRLDVLVKAIRRVKRGKAPATAGLAAATSAASDAWQAAAARLAEEKAVYGVAFAAAEERLERELREVAKDERFREAMTWQNHHAAETGLASFLRRPAGDGRGTARDRGHAQMLASYLQRYCVKNDTIGFFGPVGWARLGEGAETITVHPGEELLAARQVYFEGWMVDALADRLAADEAMRPWLAPRLSPYLRREGNFYVAPGGQKMELGPLSSVLLAACDGTRSARVLMRELGPDLAPDKEAFLWGMLADLHAKGALRWGFQIPLTPTAERTLRDLLLAVEDEPVRARALALLDGFVAKRDAVARAAGKPDELERALGDLEAAFTATTGRPASERAGQLYAGRTLVYEDCRRDLDLELGAPFLAELAPALSLLLAGARWYTHFVAANLRQLCRETYAELSPQAGSPQVDLLTFTRAVLPRLVTRQTFEDTQRELHQRWEKVLAIPAGERRVSYRSEDLRPRVLQEFAAPGPGWQKARYHSPDLLIAAPSVEAIRRGDYQIVLGEVHLAINSLDRWIFFCQHPDPDELRAAIDADLPEPSVIPVFPKVWNEAQATSSLGLPAPALGGRMDVALRSLKDYYLDFSLDPPGFPSSQLLPIAELVVEPGEGDLVVAPRDGRVHFDVVEFYQLVLMMQAIETFRVLPAGTYTPRIAIDRVVVARESWAFPAGELEFAQAPTAAERFAAARRWAGGHELPRFFFAKTPVERKPFYVDLESPVLVEILAKAVRRVAAISPEGPVSVSEMLPGHDQLWLPDAEGNRYTCELRMVALDLG